MLLTVDVELEVEHVNAFVQLLAGDTRSGGGTIAPYIRRILAVALCCLLEDRYIRIYHNTNHESASLLLFRLVFSLRMRYAIPSG